MNPLHVRSQDRPAPTARAALATFALILFAPVLMASVVLAQAGAASAVSTAKRRSLATGETYPDARPPGLTGDRTREWAGEPALVQADASPAETFPSAPARAAFPDHPGWPTTVVGGASPPVCADLDPGVPGLETLVGSLTNTTNLYAYHQDGSLVSGYPLSLGFWIAASPSIGDLDGDGDLEIVIGDFGGNRVWALEANGTPLPGWPISVGGNVRSTAALADLDPTVPGLEIIVGVQDGTVQAWHSDGTNVPGWPVTAGNFVERCSPAVGDVNGDGFDEVFVGSWYDYNAGSTGGVYGFDRHGNTLPGWPKLTNHVSVIASPALADLDGDGQEEIIVGTYETNGRIYVWRPDGTAYPGWPYTIPRGAASGSLVSSSPAVGDLDGDGQLEIVAGSTGQCGTVYAWHRDGTVLPGWPFVANAVIDGSSPVLGDLNGDGRIEIVVGSGSGFTPFGCAAGAISKAYILRDDGTVLPGWPLDLGLATTPNPALADIDLDGNVEVILSYSQSVYAWDAPGAYVASRTPWPFYHLGIDHTGEFTAVLDPAAVPGGLSAVDRELAVFPNPWSARGSLRIEGSARGTSPIEVCDAAGRRIRVLSGASWDGRDAAGGRAGNGIYFLRQAGTGGTTRVVVVR